MDNHILEDQITYVCPKCTKENTFTIKETIIYCHYCYYRILEKKKTKKSMIYDCK
uniref:Uncharacterized protein n=1 Tax=viral metagenome TaxID=1070528 RepID=A0A6C0JPZ8_9ZZZZ